ncbi:hypothetical protein VRB23_16005 [Erwinia aphidicola]|uniref:hypothetical protein n=1 Tax=Erwinia aphidicola TaxID=68334 RepID=UPI0030D04F58
MDFKSFIIGIAIPVLAIIVPIFISRLSDKRKAYRAAAAPILEKLLMEVSAIKSDSYPFQTIREVDIHHLCARVGPRKRKSLMKAYAQYLEGHKIAKTVHWDDESLSDGVFFPASFYVKNPEEVLSKMNHLVKELS